VIARDIQFITPEDVAANTATPSTVAPGTTRIADTPALNIIAPRFIALLFPAYLETHFKVGKTAIARPYFVFEAPVSASLRRVTE